MKRNKIQGVITIVSMPFDDQGHIDVGCLRDLVDFNVEAGVHGVGIALGSEVFKLNEAERDLVLREVVESAGGRVPVVMNTGASGTDLALLYSLRAQDLGADALMVYPPSFLAVSDEQARAYYKAISDGVHIPIIIQDHSGGQVPPSLIKQITAESEWVQYVKVETPPAPLRIAQTVQACGDRVGVFGGAGGSYLVEELRRGSTGIMPGSYQPATLVRLWDRFHSGDEDEAERIFYTEMLPFLRITMMDEGVFFQATKEILVRRGLFRTSHVRAPSTPMDATTHKELDRVIDRLLEIESGYK